MCCYVLIPLSRCGRDLFFLPATSVLLLNLFVKGWGAGLSVHSILFFAYGPTRLSAQMLGSSLWFSLMLLKKSSRMPRETTSGAFAWHFKNKLSVIVCCRLATTLTVAMLFLHIPMRSIWSVRMTLILFI